MLTCKRLSIVAVMLVVLAPLCGLAQDTLVVTKAGYFLLVQDADGNPSLVKVGRVVDLKSPPDTPADPTDPPADSLRAAVKAATEAVVDPNRTAAIRGLAYFHRTLSQLPPPTDPGQLKKMAHGLYLALELPEQWAEWKRKIDDAVASYAAGDDSRTQAAWAIVADVLEGR